MNKPKISVLLPVYNGEKYLREAISSILEQSYNDFELIIINDASIDKSKQIIQSFHDPRIQYLENHKNLGLTNSLNKALVISKGIFIARQDADDRAIHERFEKQVEFLETNKKIGMVGTWAEIWKEENKINKILRHPTKGDEIKFFLLFSNPFVHSSVMIRKECFEKVGIYKNSYLATQATQDYELWSRIGRNYDLANIPQVLEIYREVNTSISRLKNNNFENQGLNMSVKNLSDFLNDKRKQHLYKDLSLFINKSFKSMSDKIKIQDLRKIYEQIISKSPNGISMYAENLWQDSLTRYTHYHNWRSRLARFIYGK